MNFKYLHPKDQIISIMKRIYDGEMTTLSGGNLSILDDEGNIWITPAGVDKGKLSPKDIICIKPSGKIEGSHKASSELPFHQAIYRNRPDLRAVAHAHPPTLVAYTITGKTPDTRYIAQVHRTCGAVAYAPYGLTGSEALGENIAETFSHGVNIVLLENHGVVCGGKNILEAYQRMEALDFCARTLVNAQRFGQEKMLLNPDVQKYLYRERILPVFSPEDPTARERKLRRDIVEVVQRSCERQLMNSSQGIVSARLSENSFLIVPDTIDRFSLSPDDIVLIKDRKQAKGRVANRYVALHAIIYKMNPRIGSVITAQSPDAMTYAITSVPFESRTIPESYIMLRDVIKVGLDARFNNQIEIGRLISDKHPVLMVENDCVLATGKTTLEAFDRLEVLEFTAKSLLQLTNLGEINAIDEERIRELEKKFFSE